MQIVPLGNNFIFPGNNPAGFIMEDDISEPADIGNTATATNISLK